MSKKRIYLDYAASTPVDIRVKEAMDPYWSRKFGNAGGIHKEGVEAKEAIEDARKTVVSLMNAHPDEIVFTSGGTESNAIGMLGVIKAYEWEHNFDISNLHIVTTTIEHPSILYGFKEYKKRGAKVDFIEVNEDGVIDLKQMREVVTGETALVSVMHVNNEVGTIEPIEEVSKIIRRVRKEKGDTRISCPYFHVDASQGVLYLSIDVEKLGVDLLSIDAQKIYGPKGCGALFIKRGVKIKPIFIGGSQEYGMRPGTEPTPLIVGLGKALELAEGNRVKESARLTEIRDYFIDKVLAEVPGAELNGARENRLPNNVNIALSGFENEWLRIALDAKGIACASRSACLEGGAGSYVVRALGKDEKAAVGSLRFSMGVGTTKDDIDYVVTTLKEVVQKK